MIRTTKLLFVLAAMLMMACSDDDNNGEQTSQTEAQQKAEVEKSLLGLQVDLSDILMGGDDIALWMFYDDSTFEKLNMSMVEARESDEDSLAMDVFEGSWEAFVNADNYWGSPSEKLNGFKATLKFDDEDLADEEFTMTYYVENAEDEDGEPLLVMLNSVVLDYQMMMAYEGDANAASMMRGFTNDIFDEKKEQIVNTVSRVKKKFGSTFATISYSNKLSGLSKNECEKFYKDANNALATMLSDFNAAKTNYAEWMTEIYTKNGENPRICDMNIPGTHDTFTYYYFAHTHVFSRWVCTQVKPISGQWEAGARVFDFRLAYDDGNDKDDMGLYHTKYLHISFEKALQEIVDQLDKHPGEMAIASLAFDGKTEKNYIPVTQATLKKFADKGKIVLNPAPDVRLNDCKGKIIVMYSYEFTSERDKLYGPLLYISHGNQYSKSTLSFPKDGKTQDVIITYQNLYEQAGGVDTETNSSFWTVKRDYFEACYLDFQKFRRRESTVWSWNQLNAYTGNYLTMSYSQNAEVMHPWAVNFVLQRKNTPLGIITMDFIGTNEKWERYYTNCETLPKVIIETNRYQ